MERIRSRRALALGGAVLAVGLVAGVGCTGPQALRVSDVLPAGWATPKPATQIIAAFNPQVQHLPDPSKDGVMGAGLVGQVWLIAEGGGFTETNGDLYVMAEDITQRPPGMPPQVMEVWHFDPVALRKLRSSDERFGKCYTLFLPYPPNWKDVTQLRINTQYRPKGDPAKEPTLPGSPQTLVLDFTPPGEQPRVRVDKDETRQTAPVQMKGMPNVARDIARGGLGAPLTGAPPALAAGTPPASPVVPTTWQSGPVPPSGMTNPFAVPPGPAPPPANTAPQLPPATQFTPERPQATVRGPHGETLNVTAMALPPGQSMPNGWTRQPDGTYQTPATATANQQQQSIANQQQQLMQQTWPAQTGYTATAPAAYQPASAGYVPASQRQQRTAQTAFNPPQQQTWPQQQPASQQQQPGVQQPGSLPPLPTTAMPPARPGLPPVDAVPGGVPPLPTTPSGVSGPVTPMNLPAAAGTPPAFDPTSPVGGWAMQPLPPVPPGVGFTPTVLPPTQGGLDAPNLPVVIKR